MRRLTALALVLTAACAHASPAAADEAAEREKAILAGGPWHYRSVRCVDTKVTHSTSRLEGAPDSGSSTVFASSLGFEGVTHPNQYARAGVTKYDVDPIMHAERPGDIVQVCLISVTLPIGGCDPDVDARGREYRVYDYRRHRAYTGMNSEHECGGA